MRAGLPHSCNSFSSGSFSLKMKYVQVFISWLSSDARPSGGHTSKLGRCPSRSLSEHSPRRVPRIGRSRGRLDTYASCFLFRLALDTAHHDNGVRGLICLLTEDQVNFLTTPLALGACP